MATKLKATKTTIASSKSTKKSNGKKSTPILKKKPVVKQTAKKVSGKLQTVVKAGTRRKATEVQEANLPKVSVRNYIVDLLLQQKWTDEEIHEAVLKYFGDLGYRTKKAYIQLTRADMNAGHIKTLITSGTMTSFIDKLERNEKGKLVHIPYRPSALRKSQLQFDVITDNQ
jgi:hypothetical protein